MLKPAVLVAVLVAACHGSDPDPSRSPPSASAPAPARAPAPTAAARRAAAPQFALGGGLEMRRPIHDGHLTIIPIALADGVNMPPADAWSLDEAMAQKQATVREVGDFYKVRVKNKSARPLFVMAGELVLGGRQDHAFAENHIFAPHTSEIVPVFCIERGRSEGGKVFESGHAMVDALMRRTMRFATQSDVWALIEKQNEKLGLHPPTKTYRDAAALQDTGPAAARRQQILAQLGDERLVGMAAAYDGEIIALDRFTTPAMFRAHATELVGSYLAGDDGAHHEGTSVTPADVRSFANNESLMKMTDVSTETLAKLPQPEH
jgi:hypothetical protein